MDKPDLTLPPLPHGRLGRAAIRARLRAIADMRRQQRRSAGGHAA